MNKMAMTNYNGHF